MARRNDPPPPDLDPRGEPEPDWADAIRRARRERAERLRQTLGDDRPEPASIEPPPVREDAPRLEPPRHPGRPNLRLIPSPGDDVEDPT